MHCCWVLLLLLCSAINAEPRYYYQTAWSHRQPMCDTSSCFPGTGDLLLGRESRLTASSTCGMESPDRFCIVSHLKEPKKCFVCISQHGASPQHSHRIENIVWSRGGGGGGGGGSRGEGRGRREERWWQSQNGKEDVFIQLDLEAVFHFTHFVITFKTFRPAAMIVERSSDFGKTWRVYRYFAHDCRATFPHVSRAAMAHVGDVVCTEKYSQVEPSSLGEVIFRVLPPHLDNVDAYSEQVQNLLKVTNLRVNFTKLHTLGDDLLDRRDEIKEKYYYAIYDMVVRGSCYCYGHASRCVPLPEHSTNPNMVHGKCECTHFTHGYNCEKCDDFYNDLPWRPARHRRTNACKSCECNNHASRCHFDPEVYEQSGRTGGGVCDDCQHNTVGRHCQLCQPFHFRQPNSNVRDPGTCRPCNCHVAGSEHGGECQKLDDPDNNLVAGRCICKRFVEGTRCERCQNGYWNLRAENAEGCEPCSCSLLGTVGNSGCDKTSGLCRCKRLVTGKFCDQCLPQHYGLGEDEDGCAPCDCDLGGAESDDCGARADGQCTCRANVNERTCTQARPGFFTPPLDFLRHEGETAAATSASGGQQRPVIREGLPGRPNSWTGPGFMRCFEGDTLTFTVDNVPASMDYDVVLRYEPQMRDRWDEVRVRVRRPGPVDERGACANRAPRDDSVSLPHGTSHVVVSPASCLEKGVTYTVELDFASFRRRQPDRRANVLVDSIVLLPTTESMAVFQQRGDRQATADRSRREFQQFRCREQFLAPPRRADVPPDDVCRKHVFSVSAYMYGRAIECDCDRTGSISAVCDPYGGQCSCKPNVVGRRCDQCAPGMFGFGPEGCRACDCDQIGAKDNLCDVKDGQCGCAANVFGRQCNLCQKGFYGFPSCRPCRCSGRADECDNLTGFCIGCRGKTGGQRCERCGDGYYGDPRPGSQIGCRQCMCPGGVDSSNQHADTCRLDMSSSQVTCACHPGHVGSNCDRCAENYFGHPRDPGGKCRPCTCNDNVDLRRRGNCDKDTGECLRCLYNTAGRNCEVCREGFHGDAGLQQCRQCICNILGTDRGAGACDPRTGQCPCLPNVRGAKCDECAADHWKIASGVGCEACDCDPDGSAGTQCNQYDGQCRCERGRGGRTCADCPNLQWGDPSARCHDCQCHPHGSRVLQCDRSTGRCQCSTGVGGDRCDRCDRGTTGTLPNCTPCGECFDDWDDVIGGLKNESGRLVEKAGRIQTGGLPGAFVPEFGDMDAKLDEVRRIISGANVTSGDVERVERQLRLIRSNLTQNSDALGIVDNEITETNIRVELAKTRMDKINSRVDELEKSAKELEMNATDIRELDVSGAYNSTRDSLRKANEARRKVEAARKTIADSERTRKITEDMLDGKQDEFDRKYQENEDELEDVGRDIDNLDDKLVDLNEMVCDGRGDPCDASCGGAGCGKCGGLTCGEGAIGRSELAAKMAKDSEKHLQELQGQAEEQSRDLAQVQGSSDEAKSRAQEAYDLASQAKNQSESAVSDMQEMITEITDFLNEEGARPEDIRQVAEEVLALTISLTPQEIKDLARRINDTIRGLTNIDQILRDTANDLNNARNLKDRADRAKDAADSILKTAQMVLDALKEAKRAQDSAVDTTDEAENYIQDIRSDLLDIDAEINSARNVSTQSSNDLDDMNNRLSQLKQKYTENELNVERAEKEAEEAERKAEEAEQDAQDLENKYSNLGNQLDVKFNATQDAKLRANKLRERATRLYQETSQKVEQLKVMEGDFSAYERSMSKLSINIDEHMRRMTLYLRDIQKVAMFHRTCQ